MDFALLLHTLDLKDPPLIKPLSLDHLPSKADPGPTAQENTVKRNDRSMEIGKYEDIHFVLVHSSWALSSF